MINCIFTTLHDYLIEGYILFMCEPFYFFNQIVWQSNHII